MSTAALTPPAPASAADASDWARALLERQLWILGQLAEGGLEIARAIERSAIEREAADRATAPRGASGPTSPWPMPAWRGRCA